MAKRKAAVNEDVTRISFRLLDEAVAEELSRRARAAGTSRHDLARDLVMAGLSDGKSSGSVQSEGLLEEICRLRAELQASRDLPSEAVREVAEEIHNGVGAQVQELRSDLAKLTAQVSQASDEAGTDQILDQLERLAGSLKGVRPVGKLLRLLRGDLASSVNVLLVHAGKLTQEDARTWVQNTLTKES